MRYTKIFFHAIHDALEMLFCSHLTSVIRLETGLNPRSQHVFQYY